MLEWLEQKHAISDSRATEMLGVAKSYRKRVIREKALYGAIVSGGAALITGGLVAIQIYGGMVFCLPKSVSAYSLRLLPIVVHTLPESLGNRPDRHFSRSLAYRFQNESIDEYGAEQDEMRRQRPERSASMNTPHLMNTKETKTLTA